MSDTMIKEKESLEIRYSTFWFFADFRAGQQVRPFRDINLPPWQPAGASSSSQRPSRDPSPREQGLLPIRTRYRNLINYKLPNNNN